MYEACNLRFCLPCEVKHQVADVSGLLYADEDFAELKRFFQGSQMMSMTPAGQLKDAIKHIFSLRDLGELVSVALC